MDKNQLLELRNKIVEKTQQLAVNGQGSPADRLLILLDIIKSGGANAQVLNAAYELAGTIEGDDEKLTALLDILYQVDAQLAAIPEQSEPQAQPEHHENYDNHDNHQEHHQQ